MTEDIVVKAWSLEDSMNDIDWDNCPDHVRPALENYILNRIGTGGFLYQVLVNDLFGAFGRADEINKKEMDLIIRFLFNEVPTVCYGTPKKVAQWLQGRIYRGEEKDEEWDLTTSEDTQYA